MSEKYKPKNINNTIKDIDFGPPQAQKISILKVKIHKFIVDFSPPQAKKYRICASDLVAIKLWEAINFFSRTFLSKS